MIARQKEKINMEQVQHLQEVIEMLKERCPEFTSRKDPAIQRHCSLCHAPLLKRCHRVAQHWVAPDVTEEQVSLPLSLLKPAERHPVPLQQLKSRAGWSLKLQLCPWLSNGSLLCPDCQSLGNKSKWKGRSSAVHSLRPHWWWRCVWVCVVDWLLLFLRSDHTSAVLPPRRVAIPKMLKMVKLQCATLAATVVFGITKSLPKG